MNRLYAITDSLLMPGNTLCDGVTAALEGGCRWIQYRDKSNDKARRLADAQSLLDRCNAFGATLLINDDVDLACAINAHGMHMGQTDGSVREARMKLGADAILGVTCHDSLELAEQAVADGATYIAFGRFFNSKTKPEAPPAPLALLGEARRRFPDTTIVAIGGIDLDNAGSVIAAGADYIAVSHALFSATDITARAREFGHRSA